MPNDRGTSLVFHERRLDSSKAVVYAPDTAVCYEKQQQIILTDDRNV